MALSSIVHKQENDMIKRFHYFFLVLIPAICMISCTSNPPNLDTCTKLAHFLKMDKLNDAFQAESDLLIKACNANPRRTELWKDDPAQKAKLDAYCKISPVFRACFVCNRLARRDELCAAPNYRSSYQACSDYFSPDDRRYARMIWSL